MPGFDSTTTGSSFIPKKPLVTQSFSSRRSVGIVFPVAMILFLGSLGAYGAAYLYRSQLNISLANEQATIANQEKEFEPALLQELGRLTDRLTVSKELLDKHLTVVPFLQFLSNATIHGIRYNNFVYTLDSASNKIKIRMNGTSVDYDAIALQSDAFGKETHIQEFLFSDLSLGKDGSVGFTLTMSVDQSLFSYADWIRKQQ